VAQDSSPDTTGRAGEEEVISDRSGSAIDHPSSALGVGDILGRSQGKHVYFPYCRVTEPFFLTLRR